MVLDDRPVSIRRLVPQHPVLLDRIVDRLFTKAPDGRQQSADALADDLRLLRDKVGAPFSKARLLAAAVAAVAAVLIAVSC